MSDEKILSSRHFSYDEALFLLKQMGQSQIMRKYPVVGEVDFRIKDEDSGLRRQFSQKPRTKPVFRCRIGIRELFENEKDGAVRDVDLVWAGKHIMHEAWHLHQMMNVFQQKDLSRRNLDMARMEAIAEVFHGYHDGTYGYRPAEVDADIHGFKDVVVYFNKHILDADGTPLLDAKACLAARVHELPMWRGDKSLETYEELVDSLEKKRDDYKSKKRPPLYDATDLAHPYMGKRIAMYAFLWSDVLESTESVGIERDKELLAVALDLNSYGADVYRGLDKEVKRVRQAYPSRLNLADRMENGVQSVLNKMDKTCEDVGVDDGTREQKQKPLDLGGLAIIVDKVQEEELRKNDGTEYGD